MKKNIKLMPPQWIEYPALSGMKHSHLNSSESTKRFSLILASGIIITGQ